jgi:hypothetical protein
MEPEGSRTDLDWSRAACTNVTNVKLEPDKHCERTNEWNGKHVITTTHSLEEVLTEFNERYF